MPRSDYPAHAFLPQLLTKEEIAEPNEVITDFFNAYFIPSVREELREILQVLVTGTFSHILSRKERSDMVYFYSRLEKLIEAVHVINQQRIENENKDVKK